MSVEIKGLDGVIERIEGIADETKIQNALNIACMIVERAAKQNAQALSEGDGTLAGSIASRVDGYTGIVYTPLFYAPYVEYGTGKEAKHPEIPGRSDVPWVYVKHSGREGGAQKSYTQETAEAAVAALRAKGLDAHYTYGQKPQPFMRPALDDNKEAVLNKLREGLIQR